MGNIFFKIWFLSSVTFATPKLLRMYKTKFFNLEAVYNNHLYTGIIGDWCVDGLHEDVIIIADGDWYVKFVLCIFVIFWWVFCIVCSVLYLYTCGLGVPVVCCFLFLDSVWFFVWRRF